MQFVEGDSLSRIIECGPIPLDNALQYAAGVRLRFVHFRQPGVILTIITLYRSLTS